MSSSRVLRAAMILMIAGYAALQARVYFAPAFVPDETLFVAMVHEHGSRLARQGIGGAATGLLFDTGNWLGYGAAFWIGATLAAGAAHVAGASAAWMLRGVSFVLFLVPAVLIVASLWRRQPRLGAILLLLWLSTPLAWWHGKLVSAEPLVLALASLTVWLALRAHADRWRPAALLAGALVGLKISAAPAAAFALAVICLRAPHGRARRAIAAAGLALAGLIAANPVILRDPASFLDNLRTVALSGPLERGGQALRFALAQPAIPTWDLVQTGGAFAMLWSVPAAIALAAAAATARLTGAVWAALLVMALTCAATLSLSKGFFAWYLLPLAPVVPLVFAFSGGENRRRDALLAAAAIVNTMIVAPSIVRSFEDRREYVRALAVTPAAGPCVAELVRGAAVGADVLDLSEVGAPSAGRTAEPTPIDWPAFGIAPDVPASPRVHAQLAAYLGFQNGIMAADGTPRPLVLVIGDRFSGKRLAERQSLPVYAGPDAPGAAGAMRIGRCGTVNVWRLAPAGS